jgi:hypothetical protein
LPKQIKCQYREVEINPDLKTKINLNELDFKLICAKNSIEKFANPSKSSALRFDNHVLRRTKLYFYDNTLKCDKVKVKGRTARVDNNNGVLNAKTNTSNTIGCSRV